MAQSAPLAVVTEGEDQNDCRIDVERERKEIAAAIQHCTEPDLNEPTSSK